MTLSMANCVAIAALCATAVAGPPAQATPQTADSCFRSRDWNGWSTPGDANVVLLRVARSDIYRVDLSPGVKVRKDGFNVLLSKGRGGQSWVCTPMDLDLVVSDRVGGQQPLIARSLRKLTPAEVAAIPQKDLP